MVKLRSWVRPKDVLLRMRPLTPHVGPYGDVLGTKSVLGIDVPKMSRNIERLQIQVKSFENVWRSAFLGKLQALNLQLCRKKNSTTTIVYLLGSSASKKTSKKIIAILKCKLCYSSRITLNFQLGCLTKR